MEDTRNLIDEYKGLTNEQIFNALSKTRTPLEIAVENNTPRAKPLHEKAFAPQYHAYLWLRESRHYPRIISTRT